MVQLRHTTFGANFFKNVHDEIQTAMYVTLHFDNIYWTSSKEVSISKSCSSIFVVIFLVFCQSFVVDCVCQLIFV